MEHYMYVLTGFKIQHINYFKVNRKDQFDQVAPQILQFLPIYSHFLHSNGVFINI